MALMVLIIFLCTLAVPSKTSPFLLLANRKDIRLVDVEAPRSNSSAVISHLDDAAALDFFYSEGRIFWTDIGEEIIKGMYINDSKSEVNIITTGLISPDGLACDWLGKKLYWTDSETKRIEVSNFDGNFRKVLFWKDLDQPRALALVPMDGLMFWTDWGEMPKIERAGMNGDPKTRKVIVSKDIFWPNGIAVDYDKRRIFWADAKLKFISSMDFDGKFREIIVSGNLSHPFALTIHRDMLYWTDWQSRAIHSCNKKDNCNVKSLVTGNLSPMGIHVYLPERQPLGSTPCDNGNGGCSHLCLISPNKPYYSCACPTGVRLLKDGRTCANGAQEILLLVRRTDVRRISLDTPDYTDVVLQLDGIKHAIAIDYDPVERYIYWTDDEARAIRRAYLDGTNQKDLIVTEVHHPDGIAVDWVARNFYWTDTGTDRIEVARLNGTSRKILITENLEEPRAIVLDPPEGYMYWTDWGSHPKIERATLDGSDRVSLVSTDLGWPNGLSIDYKTRKLYWGDAKTDKIEMSNLDGTDRRELVSDQLPHIFGFTLLGNFVYWTDWQRRSIERVHKVTGGDREIIIDHLPDLMGLKAVKVDEIHGSNPCADNNGNCSHLCLNRPGNNYVCTCPMGLELTSDNRTCIIPEAFLIFSGRANIRRISLESNHNDVIPVSGVQEASALDYDINDNRIYWTDTGLKTISRAFINGSNIENVVEFGLQFPDGMAVDWVAHNLYWTDMGSNRIEVARLDGSSRKVLLWKDLEDPRAIALDPSEGFMYWSDWGGQHHIERAAMDGTHRTTLINKVGRASGLTIDYKARRLFWTDIDANVIESSDLSGNNRVAVITENLSKPYCLTQYQDYIYWTDLSSHSIERAIKTNGKNRTIIQSQLEFVMDILIFHTSRQSGWNPCAVNNGGCSHLCLALPTIGVKSYIHHCDCPTHYYLAPDNKTCTSPRNFMLFSQKNSISRVVIDSDSPDIILPIHGLKNIKALEYDPLEHFLYWIDGRMQSIRRGYDNGTKVSTIVPNSNAMIHPFDLAIDPFSRLLYWTCAQNNVINVTYLNGKHLGVIIEGEEERPRFIALHPAKGLMFWTNMIHPPRIERASMSGQGRTDLISVGVDQPGSLTVDVQNDILFWTDLDKKCIKSATITGQERKTFSLEQSLQPVSLTVHGRYLYWIDRDQQVIERIDKITGNDRMQVQKRMTHLTSLVAVNYINHDLIQNHPCAIANGGCSHLCLIGEDGKQHCACPMDLVLSDKKTCTTPPTCLPNHIRCHSEATCIPERWRCDGSPECKDMSDEMNCPECKRHQFRCRNGDCVDWEFRCDGTPHCQDESDESCCQKDKFLCISSRQCIDISAVCNGKNDCTDSSDENPVNCKGYVGRMRSHAGLESNANYSIGVIVAVVIIIVIALLAYFCKRKSHGQDETEETGEVMMSSESLNPQPLYLPSNVMVPTRCSQIGGNTNARITLPPSSSGQIYDRNHVTGASSSSSSGTPYPEETLNPPPSPVTVHSQCVYGYCCSSRCSSSLRSYKHYRSRNRPPPPTPCSTDVCDDSEPYPYRNRYYSKLELSYDSDPYPPPPTPRSHYFSDENYISCPPSPSTERSFCKPCPPPPSPVPEFDC